MNLQVSCFFYLQLGVWMVDVLVSGFGGCLYVCGVFGNVVMEDVVYMLYGMGFDMVSFYLVGVLF